MAKKIGYFKRTIRARRSKKGAKVRKNKVRRLPPLEQQRAYLAAHNPALLPDDEKKRYIYLRLNARKFAKFATGQLRLKSNEAKQQFEQYKA